jgi:serine-type D-Ala-D-Ala carboxypeptidase/endopeptidase
MRYLRVFILILLGHLGVAKAQPAYDLSRVDAVLRNASTQLGAGFTAILQQGDREIFRQTYGNGQADRVMPIASATKWLSAAVLMSVVDEGKLSLDDPIGKHLPYMTGDKARITIRQLFSHTSGWPGETATATEVDCIVQAGGTLAACAEEISRVPLGYEPGTAFAYGSLSMQVAGRICEVVTGKRWVDLFEERLTTPLGMTRTVAARVNREDNPIVAGGAFSTANDYMRFLTMILNRGVFNGRRILSVEAIQEMQADQTFGAEIAFSPFTRYAALRPGVEEPRYGLGEWRERLSPAGEILEINSLGALGFSPWIDLERNLAGVIAIQDQMVRVQPFYLAMKSALHQAVPPVPLRISGVTHAATNRQTAIAPNTLLSLYGSFGVAHRVLFDGVPGEVAAAVPGQVNVAAPTGVDRGALTRIVIEEAGSATPELAVPTAASAPGLFAENGRVFSERTGNAVRIFATGVRRDASVWLNGSRVEAVASDAGRGITTFVFRAPTPGEYAIEIESQDRRSQPGVVLIVE